MTAQHESKKVFELGITTFLLLAVAAVSYFAIALVWNDSYHAWTSLLAVVAVLPLLKWLRVVPRRCDLYLFAVLVIAFAIRARPSHYLLGGQDQGTYYIFSKHLDISGSTFYQDKLGNELPESLQQIYRDSAWIRDFKGAAPHCRSVCEDRYEGVFSPGVYVADRDAFTYVFQFLPLHPIWMSIFANVFGDYARPYSLTFFSLLGIWLFMQILRDAGLGLKYVLVGGLLLALNPLHSFLSIFPVTEIPALCFNLAWIYLLQKALRQHDYRYALFAGLVGGCYFFTRISGFTLLPIFLACLYAAVAFKDDRVRAPLIVFVTTMMAMLILGLIFVFQTSYPYAYDILSKYASLLYQLSAMQITIYLVIATLLILFIYAIETKFKARVQQVLQAPIDRFNWIAQVLTAGLFAVIIYQAYLIFFTETGGLGTRAERVGIAGAGWSAMLSSCIALFFCYTGILFSIFCVAFVFQKSKDSFSFILRISLLNFFGMFGVMQVYMVYQYYYGRYMISEFIPMALLGGVLLWGRSGNAVIQKLGWASAVLAAIAFGSISYRFVGHEEISRAEGFINDVESIVGEDVLFLHQTLHSSLGRIGTELLTPFKFGTRLKVIRRDGRTSDPIVSHMLTRGRVYYLSDKLQPTEDLVLVKSFDYKLKYVEQVARIPFKKKKIRRQLHLYEIKK